MNGLFLASEALNDALSEALGGVVGAVVAVMLAVLAVLFLLMVGIYIYGSCAYMSIAKKAKDDQPWLAWIPIVGKPLLTARIAKMPWWPLLFLLGYFFYAVPFIGPVIGYASLITFTVFFMIWRWKTYEKIGHPGWYSLLFLVPLVGYVFLGIVAWSKENIIEPIKKPQSKPKAKKK